MFSDRADSWQVAYRDGDVYSDADTTRTAGQARADLSECPVANGAFPREQLLSLTYDTFLGHHALAYLARAAYTGFGLEESFISDVAKSAFKEAGASALELPPTCFTYDDRLYPNGECHLINTGMLPIWR